MESKARQLADARMINYDKDRGTFVITDLGRIAAKYYIRVRTVEALNDIFRPKMGEADVLNMLCKCTEVPHFFIIVLAKLLIQFTFAVRTGTVTGRGGEGA